MAWEVLPLADICDFTRGLTYKKSDEVPQSSNGVLRANNISLDSGRLNLDEIRYISPEIEIPLTKRVKPDTLMVCTASGSKSHLGKVALIEEDLGFAFGGFMGLLTPSSRVLAKFLFWWTRSDDYTNYIDELSDGANINNLKWSQLGSFLVPVPPLPEQRRIVAILDEAFAAIETATAAAEKNLANARELFERSIDVAISDCLASGAIAAPIEEIVFDILDRRGVTPKKLGSDFVEVGHRVISAKSIRRRRIDWEQKDARYVDGPTYQRWMATSLLPGDVLLTSEAPLGEPAYIDEQLDWCIGQRLFCIRPDTSKLVGRYLFWALQSDQVRRELLARATGATAQGIRQALLRKVPVPLPSVESQRQVAVAVDQLEELVEALLRVYTRKLSLLGELKQSLLQKAFRGEV